MTEFDEAIHSLNQQASNEIIRLKNWLNEVSDEEIKCSDEKRADALEQIFYAMDGLRKIAGAAEYLMCWEDNGTPPTLSMNINGCHRFN